MHALAILFAVTKHLVRILTTTSDIGTLEFTSYALQVCGLIFYFYFDVVGAWVCVVVGGVFPMLNPATHAVLANAPSV